MLEEKGPNLLFISGLQQGESVQVESDIMIIGRDASADIQLDSPFISRQHAEIRREGGYWYIIDLFSKNGVFRNMSRIEPGESVPLHDRDEVQIGSVSVFKFQDPESTIHESQIKMHTSGLWLDEPNRDVYILEKKLKPPLTQQQFDLLSLLFHRQHEVVSYEKIVGVLWPEAVGGVESAAIDNAISRLRSRLAELDGEHDYIETVRGIGRRFVQREG
jgi:DNA-binding response OmpR family regulator